MVHLVTFVLLVGATVGISPVHAAGPAVAEQRHCVVHVGDQEADGQLVTTSERCFDTFSAAVLYLSEGSVRLPNDTPVAVLDSSPGYAAKVSSFTIGIHYDYSNGGGSSISVVGSSCVGGWWNTPTWFDNRESSSYNGCYRLKHWDYAGAAGSYQSTLTVGQTDNLTYMSNRVESVSYHSS